MTEPDIDVEAARSLELMARAIFTKVLTEPGKSGELLWRLFNGDGVTMDPVARKIVFLPASVLAQLAEGE